MISANFSPRGASPAVRTVHLCKFLHEAGHELKVLTYDEPTQLLFSPPDPSLASKVPAEVEVCRIPAGVFHRRLGRSKRRGADVTSMKKRGVKSLLSSLIVPDPHVAARGAFVQAASDIITAWRPDALLTFSYPFTTLLVGAALKQRFPEVAWVADYGDPWTGSPVTELNLPPWRLHLDKRIEARALRRADAVTMTTEPTARLYEKLFPFLRDRVRVVTMGYDPADLEYVAPTPRSDEDIDKVLFLHAGRLYREARDPAPFFQAVAALREKDPSLAERLKVILLGEVEPSIREEIEASAARELVVFHGWVTVEESLARMKAADQLLLFGNQGEMQIPGKAYQYMGAGRPVFMTCESEQDPTVGVLKQYGHANIVSNEAAVIESALAEILAAPGRAPDTGGYPDFAWPALAKTMGNAIQSACGSAAGFSARAST